MPYLACLVFGAMYSLCYVLEAIFIFGLKVNKASFVSSRYVLSFQDVALIAAMCGFLSCCVLLSHIFPVFLVMTLPRPTSTSTMTTTGASPDSTLDSDSPPGYDTLMASQLPCYDDSIVQKTQVFSQLLSCFHIV